MSSHVGRNYMAFHNIENLPDIRYYIDEASSHYKGYFTSSHFLEWIKER